MTAAALPTPSCVSCLEALDPVDALRCCRCEAFCCTTHSAQVVVGFGDETFCDECHDEVVYRGRILTASEYLERTA